MIDELIIIGCIFIYFLFGCFVAGIMTDDWDGGDWFFFLVFTWPLALVIIAAGLLISGAMDLGCWIRDKFR